MKKTLFIENLFFLSIVFGSVLCQNRTYDDRIHFNEDSIDGRYYFSEPSAQEARLDQIRRLSQILDIDEFLDQIEIPKGMKLDDFWIGNRFGGERSNGEVLRPAICMPELQPVCIKNSSTSLIYHPACVRVNRCGGCCGDSIYSCQPTETTTRNVRVLGFAITSVMVPGRGMELKRTLESTEIEPVEEHTKCACSCKRKAEDCSDKQEYRPRTCSCVCKLVDEKTKCMKDNDTKVWNDATCTCSCRGSYQCTTGYHYDHSTCSCREIVVGTRYAGDDKWKNSQKHDLQDSLYQGQLLTPVYTVSEDDPRRKHKEDPE